MVIGGLVSSEMAVTGEDMLLLFNEEAIIPSSVTSVLSNYVLLFDILLRLPILSLVLFKSVSKDWFNIIKSPDFIKLRREIPNIDPPFALRTQRYHFSDISVFESFNIRVSSNKSIGFSICSQLPIGRMYVEQSCNGLLLCTGTTISCEYLVHNPTLKQVKRIDFPTHLRVHAARMAFDPTKSPYYKIIQIIIHQQQPSDIKVHIYSSKTHTWNVCGDTFSGWRFQNFGKGVYWKDAIHWLNTHDHDEYNELSHFKLDIQCEQLVLTKLKLPKVLNSMSLDSKSHFEEKLFESRGCLLLIGRGAARSSRTMVVYEMRHGFTNWSVKYIVYLDVISTESRIRDWVVRPCTRNIVVSSIVLGEREDESSMIIELLGKVVQYNPVLRTHHRLDDLESFYWNYYFTAFDNFQLIASFAAV